MLLQSKKNVAPIRVLMISPSSRHPGGITRAIDTWLGAGLAERVEVEIISTSAMDSARPLQTLQAVLAMCRMASRLLIPHRRPNVVHLHISSGGSLYRKYIASCLARLMKVPVLVHIHSGGFEDWIDANRIHRTVARRVVGSSVATIVLAEHWRPLAEQLGSRQIYVIPHTLTPKVAKELGEISLSSAKANIDEDHFTFLYFGRWTSVKGLDVLADAVSQLSAKDQEKVAIRIFGNGDRRWVEHCFRTVSSGTVSICGWLSDTAKTREFSSATAVIVPSRREAFGASILEIMAAGVPLITSDTGPIPEIVQDYPLARMAPAGDPGELRKVLSSVIEGDWPPKDSFLNRCELPTRFSASVILAQLVEAYTFVSRTPVDV